MAEHPYIETPPKLSVSITNTCNLKCRLCYGDCTARPAARELTTQEWFSFIDYLVTHDFIKIYIEGGEPQFRPDLDAILEYCGRKMLTWVRTHGTLMTRLSARRWKDYGVAHVFVDLMGATAKTHEYFTGVPGSFRKTCAAVRHLRDAGIATDTVLIMTRRNVGELQEYLELAHRLGAGRAGVLRLYPLGRAKRHWPEVALSIEEQMRAITGLRPPEGLKLMQSWHPNDANCCWQAAAINAFGDSIGCVYLREYVNYGNIRNIPFLDTWRNNALYKELRSGRVEHSCAECDANRGTHGGCRSTAYAFHGRWSAPDPYCSHLNEGVDLRVLPKRLLQLGSKRPRKTDT